MSITPNTNLKLIKVPLSLDNKNQLTFNNKTEQFNYFNSLSKIEQENFSYQRHEGIIRFPGHVDELIEYNYCMYQNDNYSNKWFYAFITNMTYINDNRTDISIVTDVWQTWQFDLVFKQSFVEREMININDDIPGANLLAEGLETGEFKISNDTDMNEFTPMYALAYTRNPYQDGLTQKVIPAGVQGASLNGIFNGIWICIMNENMLDGVLSSIMDKGYGDSIMTIFTVPALALIGLNNLSLSELISGDIIQWITSDFKATPQIKSLSSTPDSIDGYIPINKKLLTYPYIYLGYNAPTGNPKIYRYEDFAGNPSFKLISEINQNPTVCLIPQNYRGVRGDNLSDSTTLNGFPTIGWVTEYFNTWLAQNSGMLEVQLSQEQFNYDVGKIGATTDYLGNSLKQAQNTDIGGFISGTGNYALSMYSNKGNHDYYIKSQLAQIEKQQMLPNSGSLSASNATLLGYNLMQNNIFAQYTIKRQFAERIDKFFNAYGYLTNMYKIPNLTNRPTWNYIKTIGVNIEGYIPQQDLELIKQLFDNGITLWHDVNNFLNYNNTNK